MKTTPRDGKNRPKAGSPLKRKVHINKEEWTWDNHSRDQISIRTPDGKFTHIVSVWTLTGMDEDEWNGDGALDEPLFDYPAYPSVTPHDVKSHIVSKILKQPV